MPDELFRLTVDQYHELMDRGILTSDDRVELLEGVLVRKMSKNPPHDTATGMIADVFMPLVPKGWHVRNQGSVTLDDGEPEPDGAIVRGKRADYSNHHPGPRDVAMVIEVADSSLSRDRGIKLRSYARAGIACYWIINLIDRQIEVYTQPDATAEIPTYRDRQIFTPGQRVPLMIEQKPLAEIAVDDLMPA